MSTTLLGVGLFVATAARAGQADPVALPAARTSSTVSLEQALAMRASVRDLVGPALEPAQLGQLLWAAQGVSHEGWKRLAPSAGALYPLDLLVCTAEGVFLYRPDQHALLWVQQADVRPRLREASLDQAMLEQAPAVFAFVGVLDRVAVKYGRARGTRYLQVEVGHAAQNLLLQATALGLRAVPVGAFDDQRVREVLGAEGDPLLLVPVGYPRAAAE